jgi:hypothetical protein
MTNKNHSVKNKSTYNYNIIQANNHNYLEANNHNDLEGNTNSHYNNNKMNGNP